MILRHFRLQRSRLVRATLLATLPIVLGTGSVLSGTGPTSKAKVTRHEDVGLPRYVPPPAFREELVLHSEQGDFTMKRYVDQGRTRTEMKAEGQDMVMIEMGDEKGTSYSIMPGQKMAMKQTRAAMEEIQKKMGVDSEKDPSTPPADLTIEDLGDENFGGVAAKKLRMTHAKDAPVTGWFEKATGAPLRMECLVDGKNATIEWKNRKIEPQPAALFEVPKGYEVKDMDEMYAQMGAMQGMGGAGAMAKGMAGGMVQGMGSNLGGSLGGSVGAALGGPLGAAAGQYIGGKIGGMLGKKAASAIN